jgi:uncharacterized protein HemX
MGQIAAGFAIASALLAGGAGFYGWTQQQKAAVLQAELDAKKSEKIVALMSRDQCLADVTEANSKTQESLRQYAGSIAASAATLSNLQAASLMRAATLEEQMARAIDLAGAAGQSCPAVEAVLDTYRDAEDVP